MCGCSSGGAYRGGLADNPNRSLHNHRPFRLGPDGARQQHLFPRLRQQPCPSHRSVTRRGVRNNICLSRYDTLLWHQETSKSRIGTRRSRKCRQQDAIGETHETFLAYRLQGCQTCSKSTSPSHRARADRMSPGKETMASSPLDKHE